MMCLLLVTACVKIGPIDQAQVCAGWKPIAGKSADVDVISDRLALSIAKHNEFGKSQGCWK